MRSAFAGQCLSCTTAATRTTQSCFSRICRFFQVPNRISTASKSTAISKEQQKSMGKPHRPTPITSSHFSSDTSSKISLCSSPANSVGDDNQSSSTSPISPSTALRKLIGGVTDDELLGTRTIDALRVDMALQDRYYREELVDLLLSSHSALVVKLRCLCAVNEVIRTSERSQRLYMARKVVDAFVKEDARYRVLHIPADQLQDLLNLRLRGFISLSNYLTGELLRDARISNAIAASDALVLI